MKLPEPLIQLGCEKNTSCPRNHVIKNGGLVPPSFITSINQKDLNLKRPRREARTSGGRSGSRVSKAAAGSGHRTADA